MKMHRREESEMKSHARERESHKRKHMASGGSARGDMGLIGEKTEHTTGYDNSHWKGVNAMLKGEHPTTNMATVKACHGGSMGKPHMAAGGVGKVRKDQY